VWEAADAEQDSPPDPALPRAPAYEFDQRLTWYSSPHAMPASSSREELVPTATNRPRCLEIEAMNVLYWIKAAAAVAIGLVTYATHAAPVFTNTLFFTDRVAPNAVPGFSGAAGDYLTWNVILTSPDPGNAVAVTMSRGAMGPFTMGFSGSVSGIIPGYVYAFSTIYNPALIAGGPWSALAIDSTGSASTMFPLIADPELLPLIHDIAVSDAGLTPTIAWTVPDLTGFDPNGIELRVIASNGSQIFRAGLGTSATSFEIPEGVLEAGQTYFYRLILFDNAGGRIENRSNAFSGAVRVAFVPEPGTLGLLWLGGVGLLIGARRRRTVWG
jgi:hypothetical protein